MQKLIPNKLIIVFYSFFFLSCERINKNEDFHDEKGYFEIRYDNGIPQYIKYFNEYGKLDGAGITFKNNGNVHSFTYIKNEKVNGPSVRYYEDGNLNYMNTYIKGVKEGVSVHYNPKGLLTRKEYYRNGKFHGMQYYFDYDTGDTTKILVYNMGIKLDSIIK